MRKTFIALALLLIASLAGLAFGTSDVANVWQIIFNPFTDTSSISHQIVWELRGTRIAAAILVGASLGIAGTLAQGSTNNPLAEPTILGTSAGAALGVLIGVLSNSVEIGSVGAVLFSSMRRTSCDNVRLLACTFSAFINHSWNRCFSDCVRTCWTLP